ncbi:MAG: TetR/AcrR family transcriptional regulator [Suilimivivens sp.]
MPPRPKCTKEEIVKAAFEMTREKGIEAVAARELGKRLGTSATPIFTHFRNMHEVELEVRKLAMREFEEYTAGALDFTPAFKQFGIRMVQFAKEEPKLFRVLYMQKHEESRNFEDFFAELGDTAVLCIELLQKDYDLTQKEAYLLFRQVWMHTFSVCVLEANNICHFTDEEISEILSMEFQGELILIRSGKYHLVATDRIN